MSATPNSVSKKTKKKNSATATTPAVSTTASSIVTASTTSTITSSAAKLTTTAAAKKEAEIEYQKGMTLLNSWVQNVNASKSTIASTNSTIASTSSAATTPTSTSTSTSAASSFSPSETDPIAKKANLHFLQALRLDKNHLGAILALAKAYLYGIGVPENNSKALELYLRADGIGSVTASSALGEFYYKGIACEKDFKKALGHYTKIIHYCKANSIVVDTNIISALTQICHKLMLENNDTEQEKYRILFIKYATDGFNLNIKGCIITLLHYYVNETTNLTEKASAFQFVNKLMVNRQYKNDPFVRLCCGICYLDGYGVAPDITRALQQIDWVLENDTDPKSTNRTPAKRARAEILLKIKPFDKSEIEQKRSYEESIRLLEEAANDGDKKARSCLVFYYLHPNVLLKIGKNIPSAKYWAKKAIEDNDAEGYGWLAQIQYHEGNYQASFENYHKAKERGVFFALRELCLYHLYGTGGVEKNINTAIDLAVQYLKFDERAGHFLLGGLYFHLRDLQCIDYLEKAVQLNDLPSRCFLGFIYYFGIFVKRNVEKAMDYFYIIYKDPMGSNFVLLLRRQLPEYSIFLGNKLEFSAEQRRKLFEILGLNSNITNYREKESCKISFFADTEFNDPVQRFEGYKTRLNALKSNTKALEDGHHIEQVGTLFFREMIAIFDVNARAANLCGLAQCYLLGKGVGVDYIKGIEHLKEAAKLGNAEAQYLLAREFETNDEPNHAMSMHYYGLAAEQGHTLAKAHLDWKLKLKKTNDECMTSILSFPNQFDTLISFKKRFSTLMYQVEFVYSKITKYKTVLIDIKEGKLALESSDWDNIDQLSNNAKTLSTKASQLSASFESTYKSIYTECVAICNANNVSAEGLLSKIQSYESLYLSYYNEATACLEKLNQYYDKILNIINTSSNIAKPLANIKIVDNENTKENSDKAQSALQKELQLQEEIELKAKIERQQKREAWLRAQKAFDEKLKKKQAAIKNEKDRKVKKEFLTEIAQRSVVTNAFSMRRSGKTTKPRPEHNLSLWQTEEILRFKNEIATLKKIYHYIQSVTETHSKEKQSFEDAWVVLQAITVILGRFMEVLQFIGTKQNPQSDNISLQEAARRIRNQILKHEHLEVELFHPTMGMSAALDAIFLENILEKNRAWLALVKKLLDFFKGFKKLDEFPTQWQVFKGMIDSRLLEHLVEGLPHIPPVMSLDTCKNKIDLFRLNLKRLANYQGLYQEKTFLTIIEQLIKSKWGAVSAYIQKRQELLIQSTVDSLACQDLIRPEYINLGNHFRHAKSPLVFSCKSFKGKASAVSTTITSTITSSATNVAATTSLAIATAPATATTTTAESPIATERSFQPFNIRSLILNVD